MRRFAERRLLIATHNAGKFAEFGNLLARIDAEIVSAGTLGLPVPEETEDSFLGNARIKAHAGARLSGMVTLADDSGLCVEGLDGAPGVLTADWAETPGGRDFMVAMRRTHEALVSRDAVQPWSAWFRCTLVLAWPDGHDEAFEGVACGHLVWPPRGAIGHGYDPMFVPDRMQQTFAEMTDAQKDEVSHRRDAVNALILGCFP